MAIGERVGEVVEASTSRFVAQCHELYRAPPLGALVRSGSDGEAVYGVVAEVATRSLDPGRRAMAMGHSAESVEAVYERHPQLNRLMSTELEVMVVAHRSGGRMERFLAPSPPRIHDIVYVCGGAELLEVSETLEFLPSLLGSPVGSPDDVTAAFLRRVAAEHPDPERLRLEAGRELAAHLTGQLHRLTGILRRVASG